MNLKNDFLKQLNDSVKKIYSSTIFPRVAECENILEKRVEYFSPTDLQLLTHYVCQGSSYNAVQVKVSLMKKYLKFIGNKSIETTKLNIENCIIENRAEENVRYIYRDELLSMISKLDNYTDRCLLLFIREVGAEFEDILDFKITQIDWNNQSVYIGDKSFKISDELIYLIKETINQSKYISLIGDRTYDINTASIYLFRPCIRKTNNNGLKHDKNSMRRKLQALRDILDKRIKYENLSTSCVVDEILKVQGKIKRELTQAELNEEIKEKFGFGKNIYNIRLLCRKIIKSC